MKLLRATAVAGLCAMALAVPTYALDEDEQVIMDALEFAMRDAKFIVYHEIGHMLIGELDLPVLGKEEDAVDALAAVWLLTDDTDDDSYNALVASADGWYFNALNSTASSIEDFSHYSDHSLDIQRAYNIVCMMVGMDQETFGETADIYDMPGDQQEACTYVYEQAVNSWDILLEDYLVDGEEGEPIEIIYDEPGEYEVFAEALQESGVLEHAAKLVMNNYVLPRPITFRAAQCGEANAYFSKSDAEVTYCYELAEFMFYLYLADIAGWADTAN